MDPQQTVAKNILLLGALLTILGLGTFALLRFDPAKWTALLPALFGVAFLVLGVVAQKQAGWYRYVFYAAIALAAFALLGATGGLIKTAALLMGNPVERPAAAVEQAVSAVLCAGFLAAAVKDLIQVRRTRVGEGA